MARLELTFNAWLELEGEIGAEGKVTEGVKNLVKSHDQVLSKLFLSICKIEMSVPIFQMRTWTH